jgi:hypothetical protein
MIEFILLTLGLLITVVVLDCYLFWLFGDKKMFIVMIWEYFFKKKD